MRLVLVGVMLLSLASCGSVVSDPGPDGSGNAGNTGSSGDMGMAGQNNISADGSITPDVMPTQKDYEAFLVGDWSGTGISNYNSILIDYQRLGDHHLFDATHPPDSGGGTHTTGTWELVITTESYIIFNATDGRYESRVILVSSNSSVIIPGYVKQ